MKCPKDRKGAFQWAAEAFGTPYNERTEEQKRLTPHGICCAICKLSKSELIYRWAAHFKTKAGIETATWWPERNDDDWTPFCDKQRSLFCYLMAALSDKEFEEIGEQKAS